MEVMYEKSTGMDAVSGVNSVEEKDKTILLDTGSDEKEKEGSIVNVTGAGTVTISDYFGDEISDIETDDICDMTPEMLTLSCDSAQQVTNRVVLDFSDGRTVEINGDIVCAES